MKIIIVDEADKIIGHKERSEIIPSDIYRASGLWITNMQNKILLGQRSFSKKNEPGKWGPAVAGTVEVDETYEQNMVKEAAEEIGLKDFKYTVGPKIYSQGENHYFAQWYVTSIDCEIADLIIDHSEIEQLKWFSKEELLQKFEQKPDIFISSTALWINSF